MARIKDYPEAQSMGENDYLVIDGANGVKKIKKSNIIPEPSEDEVLLWTNPDPTAAFDSQYILPDVDFTQYKYIKIIFGNALTNQTISGLDVFIMPVFGFFSSELTYVRGVRSYTYYGNNAQTGYEPTLFSECRDIWIYKDLDSGRTGKIRFMFGLIIMAKNGGTVTNVTDNTKQIPYKIYGIK